jgi:hypothetical protein
MQAIIRDDDTSYFTRPEMLEKVYHPVWEAGIPVCLSVIPAHLTVKLQQHYIRQQINSLYDLNVPPAWRGTNKTFLVNQNRQLCSFLNKMIAKKLIDITIHGYSHTNEFKSVDEKTIKEILNKSKSLLRSCFPSASLNTVVVPYEILTAFVRNIILESNYNISIGYENFKTNQRLDRLRRWSYRIRKKFIAETPSNTVKSKGQSKIFFSMNFFSPDRPASECLKKAIRVFEECKRAEKTFICTNHYWYFFKDWGQPREDILSAWFEFIKYASSSEVKWTTFAKYSATEA